MDCGSDLRATKYSNQKKSTGKFSGIVDSDSDGDGDRLTGKEELLNRSMYDLTATGNNVIITFVIFCFCITMFIVSNRRREIINGRFFLQN